MSDRGYGILVAEFDEDQVYNSDHTLIALETIRSQLELLPIESNGVFEFDLVNVCMHSANNCYPEIGVHAVTGDLSDSEYGKLENYVRDLTIGKKPSEWTKGVVHNELPSWDQFKEFGVYPVRT